jgi:UDP-N-acetylglucosamine 2-epimerase (non-hydrolysing)
MLVNTGQNFDSRLSDVFFREMGVRLPDRSLGVRAETAAEQIGQILSRCDRLFTEEQPDRLVILGDTNSALCSIVAKRRGIPVIHMEAGNRCYDDRVPEEVNRRLVDHSSDLLLPYTERSRENLLREGIASDRIYVIGNPILEVLNRYSDDIDRSPVLSDLALPRGGYFLVTLHRAENVDDVSRLGVFLRSLDQLIDTFGVPVVVSLHPRTRARIHEFGLSAIASRLRLLDPLGFFDYVHLEKNARCVLSDSGTVQEECAILKIPNVTLRDVTERPETIECGSNILSGCDQESILRSVSLALSVKPSWSPPIEYSWGDVSDRACRIIIGHNRHFGF